MSQSWKFKCYGGTQTGYSYRRCDSNQHDTDSGTRIRSTEDGDVYLNTMMQPLFLCQVAAREARKKRGSARTFFFPFSRGLCKINEIVEAVQ